MKIEPCSANGLAPDEFFGREPSQRRSITSKKKKKKIVAGRELHGGRCIFPDVVAHRPWTVATMNFPRLEVSPIAGIFLLDEWLQYTHSPVFMVRALFDDLGKEHFSRPPKSCPTRFMPSIEGLPDDQRVAEPY